MTFNTLQYARDASFPHDILASEARHGKAFAGLLKRYFGK